MVLMRMSRRGGVGEEDVKAIQVGVKAILKRHFDQSRALARLAERRRASAELARLGNGPPECLVLDGAGAAKPGCSGVVA